MSDVDVVDFTVFDAYLVLCLYYMFLCFIVLVNCLAECDCYLSRRGSCMLVRVMVLYCVWTDLILPMYSFYSFYVFCLWSHCLFLSVFCVLCISCYYSSYSVHWLFNVCKIDLLHVCVTTLYNCCILLLHYYY